MAFHTEALALGTATLLLVSPVERNSPSDSPKAKHHITLGNTVKEAKHSSLLRA